MLELRGGFAARCCITELEEQDEWVNMPLGHHHLKTIAKNDGPKHDTSRAILEEDDKDKNAKEIDEEEGQAE
jgi:hypothetical protein